MSENRKPPAEETDAGEADEDGSHETPFDHPLFLPIILGGLSLWFFYDGFLNSDPEMLEHLTFNRAGFAALFVGALWFGYKGRKEMREDAARNTPQHPDDHPLG